MWESFSTDHTDPWVFFCLLVWDFRPFCASVALLLDNRARRFQRSRSSLMEVASLEVANQDALPRHRRCQWHNGKTCSPRTSFTKDKNKWQAISSSIGNNYGTRIGRRALYDLKFFRMFARFTSFQISSHDAFNYADEFLWTLKCIMCIKYCEFDFTTKKNSFRK